MAVYTHEFEIVCNGINNSGEIYFDNGESSFKTNSPEELTVAQHRKVQEAFEFFVKFNKSCGEIEKFEIKKKV